MAMRYQPQGIWRLAQAYRPLVAGGWLAQAGSGYAGLGPAGLTPTARFSTISGVAVTPFGYALRSNSAADSLGNGSIIASLTIGAVPARRNFTVDRYLLPSRERQLQRQRQQREDRRAGDAARHPAALRPDVKLRRHLRQRERRRGYCSRARNGHHYHRLAGRGVRRHAARRRDGP